MRQRGPDQLGGRQQLAYLGCSSSVGMFSAFSTFSLTLWLATSFTSSYLLLSVLGNGRSFVGAIVSPLAGVWSDRVWLPWLGRRRPFILLGGLLAALLLGLAPVISRSPLLTNLLGFPEEVARLVPVSLASLLFTVAFNTMDDIHKALLVDITPESGRNRLAGLATVVEMLGQLAILALGFVLWQHEVPDAAFAVTGVLVAIGVLVTVAGVREPAPDRWRARGDQGSDPGLRLSPLALLAQYPGAAAFCLSTFAFGAGLSAVLPLVSVYTRDILGASVGEAQMLPALLFLAITVVAVPMARLGDRLGRRLMISAGYVLMIGAALAGLVITTKEEGAAVFLLAGVGTAAVLVLKIPLLADLVPEQHIGAATGLLAASGSLAAPVASLVGGALSDVFGPRAVFGLMAALVLVALAVMPAVRAGEATLEARSKGRATGERKDGIGVRLGRTQKRQPLCGRASGH